MGVFDKVKFWKRNDDLGSDMNFGSDFDLGGSDPFASSPSNSSTGLPDSSSSQSNPDPFSSGSNSGTDLSSNPADPFAASDTKSSPTNTNNDPFATSDQNNFASPSPPGMGGPNSFASPTRPQNQFMSQGHMGQNHSNQGSTYELGPVGMQSQHKDDSSAALVGKEIEIISSKLDALRASLDIINQRLSNIERMNENDNYRTRYRW